MNWELLKEVIAVHVQEFQNRILRGHRYSTATMVQAVMDDPDIASLDPDTRSLVLELVRRHVVYLMVKAFEGPRPSWRRGVKAQRLFENAGGEWVQRVRLQAEEAKAERSGPIDRLTKLQDRMGEHVDQLEQQVREETAEADAAAMDDAVDEAGAELR